MTLPPSTAAWKSKASRHWPRKLRLVTIFMVLLQFGWGRSIAEALAQGLFAGALRVGELGAEVLGFV